MNLLGAVRGKHKVMLWLQYSWAQCIPMVHMKNCSCHASKSAVSFSVTSAVISHYEITSASGFRNSLSSFYSIWYSISVIQLRKSLKISHHYIYQGKSSESVHCALLKAC